MGVLMGVNSRRRIRVVGGGRGGAGGGRIIDVRDEE